MSNTGIICVVALSPDEVTAWTGYVRTYKEKITSIVIVDSKSNLITDSMLRDLMAAYKENENQSDSAITDIKIRKQANGDAGLNVEPLLPLFTPALTYVDLSINNIKDAGAKCVAKALRNAYNLKTLILADNQIGYIGAINVILSANVKLEHLDLSKNVVDSVSQLRSFCDRYVEHIKHLNLENNKEEEEEMLNTGDSNREEVMAQLCKQNSNDLEICLYKAVMQYTPDIVTMLFEKGIEKNFTGTVQGEKIMEIAVFRKDMNMIQLLETRRLGSALPIACRIGAVNLVKNLLNLGQDVNKTDLNGWAPLHYAAVFNNGQIVDLLLKARANPTIETMGQNPQQRDTAWSIALKFGAIELIRSLMCRAQPPKLLVFDAIENNNKDVVKMLIRGLKDKNLTEDVKHMTLLMKAIECAREDIAMELLSYDALCDTSDKDGNTPLHYAAKKGSVPLVAALLGKNARVDDTNKRGETALFVACKLGHMIVVNNLIAADANVNATDINGDSSLHVCHQIEIARALISAGANKKIQNHKFKTAAEVNSRVKQVMNTVVDYSKSSIATLTTHAALYEDVLIVLRVIGSDLGYPINDSLKEIVVSLTSEYFPAPVPLQMHKWVPMTVDEVDKGIWVCRVQFVEAGHFPKLRSEDGMHVHSVVVPGNAKFTAEVRAVGMGMFDVRGSPCSIAVDSTGSQSLVGRSVINHCFVVESSIGDMAFRGYTDVLEKRRRVAIKAFPGMKKNSFEATNVMLLQGINHPNIAKMLVFTEDVAVDRCIAVYEWLAYSSLYNIKRDFSLDRLVSMGTQLLCALYMLHSAGIVLGNLHPGCIRVKEDESASPVFIIAQTQQEYSADFDCELFQSPWTLKKSILKSRDDLWSIGVIMMWMYTSSFPFKSTKDITGSSEATIPPYFDKDLQMFFSRCFQKRGEYPGIKELLKMLMELSTTMTENMKELDYSIPSLYYRYHHDNFRKLAHKGKFLLAKHTSSKYTTISKLKTSNEDKPLAEIDRDLQKLPGTGNIHLVMATEDFESESIAMLDVMVHQHCLSLKRGNQRISGFKNPPLVEITGLHEELQLFRHEWSSMKRQISAAELKALAMFIYSSCIAGKSPNHVTLVDAEGLLAPHQQFGDSCRFFRHWEGEGIPAQVAFCRDKEGVSFPIFASLHEPSLANRHEGISNVYMGLALARGENEVLSIQDKDHWLPLYQLSVRFNFPDQQSCATVQPVEISSSEALKILSATNAMTNAALLGAESISKTLTQLQSSVEAVKRTSETRIMALRSHYQELKERSSRLMFKIFVKRTSGEMLFSLHVFPTDMIAFLRENLLKVSSLKLSSERLVLVYQGEILQDQWTFGKIGIQDQGCIIAAESKTSQEKFQGVEIIVKSTSGQQYSVVITAEETSLDLKKRMDKEHHAGPAEKQRLVFNGQIITDDVTPLMKQGITDGSAIVLAVLGQRK